MSKDTATKATTSTITFRADAHPTFVYKVVKQIPEGTPQKEKLPGVGKEFSFWHWGGNVIGMLLESGRPYDITDIKVLEDNGIIEKVSKMKTS